MPTGSSAMIVGVFLLAGWVKGVVGMGLPTVAMGALGLHIFHGFWSLFQTLGRNNERRSARLRQLSAALAVVVVVGFLSVPWAVLMGVRP